MTKKREYGPSRVKEEEYGLDLVDKSRQNDHNAPIQVKQI
jgi:hypothetical protein